MRMESMLSLQMRPLVFQDEQADSDLEVDVSGQVDRKTQYTPPDEDYSGGEKWTIPETIRLVTSDWHFVNFTTLPLSSHCKSVIEMTNREGIKLYGQEWETMGVTQL